MNRLAIFIVFSLLQACSGSSSIITNCERDDRIEPLCSFQNPEDIALLPDGETMIISQMGYMDEENPGRVSPGNLVEFREGQAPRILFEGGAVAQQQPQQQPDWGDPQCPGAPSADFSPHGIDLDVRLDGRLTLLAVNHGGRESIEIFEVMPNEGQTALLWRGCVVMPDELFMNDVVATRNNGFWATHMFPRHSTWALIRSLFGAELGYVVSWTPEHGVKKIPGSDGAMPNGIEKSTDERYAFINMYLTEALYKLDVMSGEVVKKIELASPDNSIWDRDGKHLLVASHVGSFLDAYRCQGVQEGACGFAFEIVRVNSDTLDRETIFAHEGAPMGGATVALPVNDYLYLGMFAGDRIARIAYGSAD